MRANRKGQSGSNAGIVLVVITVLIIIYIMFLPPADREDLLSGGTGTGGHGTTSGGGTVGVAPKTGIILQENPGKIYAQKEDGDEFEMSSFTISTSTLGDVIKSKTSLFIKSSAFEEKPETIDFSINPDLSDNLILSFNVDEGLGRLTVTLNGKTVYVGEIEQGNSPPIYLDKDDLDTSNTLRFSVSGPGVAFWRSNEYVLRDIKITGDITDTKGSYASQTINLDAKDLQNLKSARLRYLAECKEEEVRGFDVRINGYKLFSGIPDCAVYSYLSINPEQLLDGRNEFEFELETGRVLIDRLQLEVKYDSPDYPTYYFDMANDFFVNKQEEGYCGKVDGQCPANCGADEDKDCCFERRDNYWCDIETPNLNDRCVSFVNDCERCASGYEDRYDKPPKVCVDEDKDLPPYCGDDTDGYCPAGCSKYYDKDCCFEAGEENFWCNDVPQAGITSVCEESIENEECDDCPDGYVNKDGKHPQCTTTIDDSDLQSSLKDIYKVELGLRFPNDDQKRIGMFINGLKIGINTARESITRDISQYVEEGTNSIEIQPEDDVSITELRVTVK